MSVNGNPGPDLNAALLQAQQHASQGQQSGPRLNIFTPFLSDADVFSGLSSKGKGFNCDAMIMRAPNAKPKLFDKVTAAMASALEDFKKAAQGAGVMYSGDLPSGSMPGSGGSFASMAQSHSHDDHGHGHG